ncbi:Protein SOGA1 [Trichinella spiralis]|uniref:Protein SOGA1 n=1 Tax=Trichinella spiralis TaxID=6334 RepID=A0ABR3KYQ2_TRISP
MFPPISTRALSENAEWKCTLAFEHSDLRKLRNELKFSSVEAKKKKEEKDTFNSKFNKCTEKKGRQMKGKKKKFFDVSSFVLLMPFD